MLFFFRKTDVPDGASFMVRVTGDTMAIGMHGTLSVDGGPTVTWDTSQPLPLRSPHRYTVDVDIVTTQAASITLEALVIASVGNPLGSAFSQSITAQPGDLNTLTSLLRMTP